MVLQTYQLTKRGWDDDWEFYSNWGEKGVILQEMLIDLVDEDTNAFNSIIKAFSLPKDTAENLKIRDVEIQKATKMQLIFHSK